MKNLFEVTELNELLALHRALFEAKFSEPSHDRDVAGSQFVADMACRIVEELAKEDPSWNEWRQARNHPERVEIVRQKIIKTRNWEELGKCGRENYVKILLSPLVPDEELLHDLAGIDTV